MQLALSRAPITPSGKFKEVRASRESPMADAQLITNAWRKDATLDRIVMQTRNGGTLGIIAREAAS